jgi:hypothetical protein
MKAFLLTLAFCSTCHAQGRLLAQTAPVGCGITLASITMTSGSSSYLRLRYELEALTTAQDAVTSMNHGLQEFNAETSPSLALSSLITGTNEAHDALRCAAAVIAKYPSERDTDQTIKGVLTLAYNQEASVMMDLQKDLKKRFPTSTERPTHTATVRDAEHLSAMTATQKSAADSLLLGTTMSLMLAVDMSDPTAKDTAKTLLSCNEFEDLRTRSAALLKSDASAYTNCASLFITFLDGHECRQ